MSKPTAKKANPNLIPDGDEPKALALLKGLAKAMGEKWVVESLIKVYGEEQTRLLFAELGIVGGSPAVPPPAVVVNETWQQRLARPFLLMDGPAYYWHHLPDAQVVAWLTAVRDAGLDGVDLELSGESVVDEYNHGPQKLDCGPILDRALARLAYWLSVARPMGLIVSAKICQSNWSSPNLKPDAFWYQTGQRVASLGSIGLICLAVNEDDDRVRDSIRSAIEAGLYEGGFMAEHVINWLKPSAVGLSERHPKNISDLVKGDRRTLQITDNGGTIEQLYGTSWRTGGTINAGNLTKFVQGLRASGTSGGIYSFQRKPDYDALRIAGAAWRGAGGAQQPASPVGTVLYRGRSYGQEVLQLGAVSMSRGKLILNTRDTPWRSQTVNKKPCNAVGLLFRRNAVGQWEGGKVEWKGEERDWINLIDNCRKGYNGHSLPVEGERVLVGIAAPDSGPAERSNLVELEWRG